MKSKKRDDFEKSEFRKIQQNYNNSGKLLNREIRTDIWNYCLLTDIRISVVLNRLKNEK